MKAIFHRVFFAFAGWCLLLAISQVLALGFNDTALFFAIMFAIQWQFAVALEARCYRVK